jgi:hypothetical protein
MRDCPLVNNKVLLPGCPIVEVGVFEDLEAFFAVEVELQVWF